MSDTSLDLGARIRMARHRRGRSLGDIAAVTKIPTMWLEAIERNDFDRLPGGIFRRAYVRAFAAEVGVDPEPLPESVLARSEGEDSGENGARPWRRHVPTVIAVALLITALMLLRVVGRRDTSPIQAPAAHEASGFESAPSPAARAAARPLASASLELSFVGSSWVSARADGERVVHRLVSAGERLEIEARRLIVVEIGDAGAVEASINGGPARVLGEPGRVRHMSVVAPVPAVPDGNAT